MGTFNYPILLLGRDGTGAEELNGLVDTGATFTSVPAAVLRRLGVVPEWQVRLGLADGTTTSREMGRVDAEIDGERRPIVCTFGEENAPVLIGAHTLEVFLLMVDPVEQRLIQKDALWM